ncbi:hypothetical protein B0H17DRAFT_402440 [Mycena rosella]|uniref:Uncharacterized protein n=1 Tax=Mycena rosella TaxID=1033263 RepID=A0AAD7GNW6_MYCRO|nr:hypothetical protein B0H17DRAFT_402440 [Mycena rosella]
MWYEPPHPPRSSVASGAACLFRAGLIMIYAAPVLVSAADIACMVELFQVHNGFSGSIIPRWFVAAVHGLKLDPTSDPARRSPTASQCDSVFGSPNCMRPSREWGPHIIFPDAVCFGAGLKMPVHRQGP